MIHQTDSIEKTFETVTLRLEEFIGQVREKGGSLMATDKWTVDDVLRHVTFWHGNYADNYKAIAKGEVLPLLVGPYYQINQTGVVLLREYSREMLLSKLHEAHKILERCILVDKVTKMQYKKDGRVMTTPEFLKTVDSHLRGHIKQIKKAH